MKIRLIFLVISVSAINLTYASASNASTISISPFISIVDNGDSGGGSGANVNVGSNCDAKGVCQGNWWKYGSFLGA
jgi:hypothetical protein